MSDLLVPCYKVHDESEAVGRIRRGVHRQALDWGSKVEDKMTQLAQDNSHTHSGINTPRLGSLLPSLLVNAVVPVVIYQFLTGQGFTALTALCVAALFPALGTLVGWKRTQHLDIIGVVSLAFIAAGMATSLISGDPIFLLAKESFLTAAFGLGCFASLLMPRPLMFYFGRRFASMSNPAAAASFDKGWQHPSFRRVIRLMTIVWGSGYVTEALVRVALLAILPIPVYLIVSQGLVFGVTVGLIAWTMAYGRKASRQAEAIRAGRLVE
jgi:hypothetical protein